MALNIKERISWLVATLKKKQPYTIESESDGIKLKKLETRYNPTNEDHSDRTFLITIDGLQGYPREVKKYGDDLCLEYEDKQCAITSYPIVIDGSEFYFTKDGFTGTMAINEDTLLEGDVYDPSKREHTRYIPVKKFKELKDKEKFEDMDIFDAETVMHNGEKCYKIESEGLGDITALHGSKKTLKEMNDAKRMRKLLQPAKLDKQRLLMAIASGVAIGYMVYPQIQ